MITVTCTLKSSAPLSFSRVLPMETKKNPRELDKDFEARIWKQRLHEENGEVIIPASMFANSIKNAAKYLGMQIPGKGKEKYTKNFDSSVLVPEPMRTGIKAEDVKGVWYYVPSDGKRGGSKRVWKCFPEVLEWKGKVTYLIFDDIITQDVFEKALKSSGSFIGIGRFRPQNAGYFGRFGIEKIEWNDDENGMR